MHVHVYAQHIYLLEVYYILYIIYGYPYIYTTHVMYLFGIYLFSYFIFTGTVSRVHYFFVSALKSCTSGATFTAETIRSSNADTTRHQNLKTSKIQHAYLFLQHPQPASDLTTFAPLRSPVVLHIQEDNQKCQC